MRVPGNKEENGKEAAPRSSLTKENKRKNEKENFGGLEQRKKAGGGEGKKKVRQRKRKERKVGLGEEEEL